MSHANFPKQIKKSIKMEIKTFEREDNPIQRDLILKNTRGVDGIISLLVDSIDAELIDQAIDLKVVSNYTMEYNNIKLDEVIKRGIRATNAQGDLTDTPPQSMPSRS